MKKTKFCECIDKYRNELYIVAWAILENKEDIEDAVSNAILKAYENLNQLRNVHKFKPWITTITKNEALKIRKKRLTLPGDDAVENMMKPVQEQYDELWDILQKMREEYRLVLVLFYYNDLSLKDIAQVLNMPIGTVKSRLSRGREMLKQELEGEEEYEGF